MALFFPRVGMEATLASIATTLCRTSPNICCIIWLCHLSLMAVWGGVRDIPGERVIVLGPINTSPLRFSISISNAALTIPVESSTC
eukprot:7756245-Karenia_brevis.AAC.1